MFVLNDEIDGSPAKVFSILELAKKYAEKRYDDELGEWHNENDKIWQFCPGYLMSGTVECCLASITRAEVDE